MRKMFIFFGAFWVSFMTIYSIYYYKVERKLDSSIVAEAKDLPHTVMGLAGMADSDKNMIYSEGVGQVIPALAKDTNNSLSPVPDADFVSFNGTYTKDHIEKFYEGLVTKFTNHPPIDFKGLKDNDKLLMSYFFENVRLPEGFRVSDKAVNVKGKDVRALQFCAGHNSDTSLVSFFKDDQTHEYALKVKLNDGKEELVMYSNPKNLNWIAAKTAADSLISKARNKHHIEKDESVLVPEIDFNIVKDFDKQEVISNSLLNNYNLVEERMKLKISPPKTGGPLETNSSYNTASNFIMNGNILFYIKQTDKTYPYCVIYVKHPEILKTARTRS